MAGYVVPDTFAAPEDLAAWTGEEAPVNAVQLLRSATGKVLQATRLARYARDETTGLPTDPALVKCLTEATCIQAAAWSELGINPLTGGVDQGGVKRSKKIGTASFEIAGAEATAAARAAAAQLLVSEAVDKLRTQNLISHWPTRESGRGRPVWPI